MRILALGDVVGAAGLSYLTEGRRLSRLRDSLGADIVIANGENAAPGNGLTKEAAETLLAAGVDVLTGGNHTFRRREVYAMLDDCEALLRPANYPGTAPGRGYLLTECGGWRLLIINLIGTVFMDPMDSPFAVADRILTDLAGRYDAAIVDFHAEATSEKIALARYLDARVSAVFGTHTHVATADARILPGGTGFITDLGMCGSHAGCLGVATDCILHKFIEKTPVTFTPSEGECQLSGALFTVEHGRCVAVESVIA